MKTYQATKRVSAKLKAVIENVIETNDKYKGCYFWTRTGNSSHRRQQEEQFTAQNEDFNIVTKKGLIEIRPTLSISCSNFYYSLGITRDGSKSALTVLKSLVK